MPVVQAVAHEPQCIGSARVSTSQPFVIEPSQSAKPVRQVSRHVPPVHDAVAFAPPQARPHAPQFVSVSSVASQPFDDRPSQFPNPAMHAPKPHEPFVHSAIAPDDEHEVPHTPQFWIDVRKSDSQPFVRRPSQSANPSAQTQIPLLQSEFAPHAAAHDPQWSASVARSTSQPFASTPSQSAWFAAHVASTHTPARHSAVAFGNPQAKPQLPQFVADVSRFVSHTVPGFASHSPDGGVQAELMHSPAMHAKPVAQGTPHEPQFAALDARFVSHPLEGSLSQSAKPVEQLHAPATQLCPAAHEVPQLPQCAVFVAKSVSHPFALLPSQSPRPAGHVQTPPTHGRPAPHALLHEPQWAGSVAASTSQPFTMFVSQSRWPGMQMFEHVAETQIVPLHALPQAPHAAGSVARFAHRPEQQVSPAVHVAQLASSTSAPSATLASPSLASFAPMSASSASAARSLATSNDRFTPPSTSVVGVGTTSTGTHAP
jgi:hypothetical protein